jgi:hypothetical protein
MTFIIKAKSLWILKTLLCTLLLGALAGLAHSKPADYQFEPTIKLDGENLVLSGSALRSVLFIRGYSIGFYFPKKINSFDEAIALPNAPFRIMIVPHKELDAKAWTDSIDRGFSKNLSDQELQQMKPFMEAIYQELRQMKGVNVGDTCSLDYIPQQGVVVVKNGVQSKPIGNRAFFNNLLGIWLGDVPADEDLKKTVLGQ